MSKRSNNNSGVNVYTEETHAKLFLHYRRMRARASAGVATSTPRNRRP